MTIGAAAIVAGCAVVAEIADVSFWSAWELAALPIAMLLLGAVLLLTTVALAENVTAQRRIAPRYRLDPPTDVTRLPG
ncbi:hypothetical protein [Rhodococcus pyridinivorans]|uniref:hypothetical protein n=1 Tax=Rhodococcus pyridinivorans TaxID=103816 RepID=UPI002078A7F2|nr:hypothetical protein [Rhodococcus pyridinivorans]USI88407.1 hypothetical protein LLA01_12220 [Rhodococcus pyridinivorans]